VTTATHILGPTLMLQLLMPRFYARVARRLAADGPVSFHAMSEMRGLGRTDKVVDSFRPIIEDAAVEGRKVRLAGHSLGGIVAWVLAHDYPQTIEVVELWCAPIRGTALAGVHLPVAEARFIAPASRYLKRYDRPVDGDALVRSIYPALDVLAVPSLRACWIEGEQVENHLVSPIPLPRRLRRWGEIWHRAVGEHVLLPRHPLVNRNLAA